ncbi:tRNA (adenine(58)-N(1))-methyltransferase catalytic subunit trm61 [Ceratocystis platani]|uniref:tRNA (adenine(58)-N(1))-methyltransferase catalytic subunit TRM61 n=1 Tax=Ceratocystis fimbriata f. sp. platani TaxID=88771 RepID=A0A0F8CUA8_CERFI|nr:tRNA (adenine(58)-N(1))-methyltransferase catalytic subunit trm61 [Ceratocystis platani]
MTPTNYQPSPFLSSSTRSKTNSLSLVYLSRENLVPLILQDSRQTGVFDGYAEGATLNSRFGSFPHSTLINVPWGSQVRASNVDTGSRGRKRKRNHAEQEEDEASEVPTAASAAGDSQTDASGSAVVKKAVTAASGFLHILKPSPELWTLSLPHRTQVVYTPDYSYVLQRIRAFPGKRIIEAGAGSGSFTHASSRAVYNGYPTSPCDLRGKVFSFEFHEVRYQKMTEEIKSHGLSGIVQMTHRDVYNGGFLVNGNESPQANCIFLDLPAPWEALHHLSRRQQGKAGEALKDEDRDPNWVSPLDPNDTVYLCTFSPCIEQVTRTISAMRRLGWVDIDMVEIAHKRFNVSRDHMDKTMATPIVDVEDAVAKLDASLNKPQKGARFRRLADKTAKQNDRPEQAENTKLWLEGRVIHRPEAEIKSHTSYLTFATLPREWTVEDEARVLALLPPCSSSKVIGSLDKEARRKEKEEAWKSKAKKNIQTGRMTVPVTDNTKNIESKEPQQESNV